MTTGRRRAPVLALVIGGGLALVLTGWIGLDLREPISFHGDHLLTLGYARSYVDGHGFRLNDRLGYPGVRDAMYHPTFYFAQKSFMWLTARATDSPMLVVSLFYGAGIVSIFAACWWSLRRLGAGYDLATLGGLAFLLTPYIAVRAGMHDLLAVCFSVPLGALLALRVQYPELTGAPATTTTTPGRQDSLVWALVFIVGASGLYYAFFTAFFVMVVGLVAAVSNRRLAPLVRSTLVCAGVVIVMLVTGPGPGMVDVITGQVALTVRLPVEQEFYGLEWREAVTPFRTWPSAPLAIVEGIARLGREGDWGEWPGPLLTLVIAMSPVIGLAALLTARRRDVDPRLITIALCALCIAAGIVFAARGSVGRVFNELVTPAIRAQNRITPFLTFFAIVLVTLGVERLRSTWGTAGRACAAVALAGTLLASAWPAIGFLQARQQYFLADSNEQADRSSIVHLLDGIDRMAATRVLQLPVTPWPEVPPIRGVDPYRFELPYILSRARSDVRWSYGLSARQPEFWTLVTLVSDHRGRDLAAAAAAIGFDAILLDKRALAPEELEETKHSLLDEVGSACLVFDDERHVLVQIAATAASRTCRVPAPAQAPADMADNGVVRPREPRGAGRPGP